MPVKILGLDIGRDHITAVQLTGTLKGYQVSSCFRVPFKDGGGAAGALRDLSLIMDLKSDTSFVSIPGEEVSYRNLRLPFRETKKIRQILPFEIETIIPFPIDDLIVDFNIVEQSQETEILAISAKKNLISDYLSMLKEFGIDPEILDISPLPTVSWLMDREDTPGNGLFIDTGFSRSSMVLFQNSKIALIRHHLSGHNVPYPLDSDKKIVPNDHREEQIEPFLRSLCKFAINTIHAFESWMKKEIHLEKIYFSGIPRGHKDTAELLTLFLGIPAEEIHISMDKRLSINRTLTGAFNPAEMNNALALSMLEPRKGRGFNLRKNEFEIKKKYLGFKKEIRVAATLTVIFFLFLSLNLVADFMLLEKRYEVLDRKCNDLFKQTFPETEIVRFPLHQMKIKIDETKKSSTTIPGGMKAGDRIIDILKDISQRIPQSMDIDVANMLIDPDSVRITGETDTFNTVTNLKERLEPSEHFSKVDISGDRTRDRIKFDMRLRRKN